MDEVMRYFLRLYVAGHSPNSVRAISNLKSFLEEHLRDAYDLEIVDVLKYPGMAEEDNIIATPTLLNMTLDDVRRLVGDMSDRQRLITGLGIEAELSSDGR